MNKLALGFVVLAAACGGKGGGLRVNNSSAQVPLVWKAVQADGENVEVTLVVAGTPHVIGKLSAAADDGPGTPRTCDTMPSPTATSVGFTCGGTPAYNHYRADVRGAELVITLETGVDASPDQDKKQEVKRIPIKGSSVTVTPYVKPAT